MVAKTLYDKLWESHLVKIRDDGTALIYVDRHLVHEVTSPQAFEGLRLAGRKPWRLDANLAVPDHNVSTDDEERRGGYENMSDEISRIQLQTLDDNCDHFGVLEIGLNDVNQGIVHVIGPETGAVLPGMTVVCGDSHTSTHGAFACLAHGIGTSEVEHVLATQCLVARKMKNMLVKIEGQPGEGVTAKDLVLAVIGKIGTAGGTGFAIEFAGEAIRGLSMEGRMTVCNMAIEAGARAGLVAVDQTTLEYVRGRPFSPQGEMLEKAEAQWKTLYSDENAHFDQVVELDASMIEPQVSWGTSPEMVLPVSARVPDPAKAENPQQAEAVSGALEYMGLKANMPIVDIKVDRVFIGSCTNSRIEDLRAAAKVAKGHSKADTVKQAMVVPGSGVVRQQAEAEGLDKVFLNAGFEWRSPGCSMCLAMNADKLGPGEHCASTSNRNFEGRQGFGGRTHLVSPAMAAAAAIAGHFVDVRDWREQGA